MQLEHLIRSVLPVILLIILAFGSKNAIIFRKRPFRV